MKIVIMAGGKGTRFWPKSTTELPKQFLPIISERTMLQLTYERFARWLPASAMYVVTSAEYRLLVQEQLPELLPDHIIIEPEQKDTGPCIALTAMHFLKRNDDEVLVMTPSDHYMPDSASLQAALLQAEQAAMRGRAIVTLGIVPTRPETGYGYIRSGTEQPELPGIRPVHSFIEKPSAAAAKELLCQPGVYWNSGTFIWKPSTIAYYVEKHQPQMWQALLDSGPDLAEAYARLPSISVDYAILEKADEIYTIPVNFVWDDVGSWSALERVLQPDADGNLIQGRVLARQASNNIIVSGHNQTVVIGVEDLIVVSTDHGLLICRKAEEQQLKNAIKDIHTLEA
ncbi:mannose-1-phosphate guanylyltransferase [Paenibacillus sp. y28]|uniref:mannose-1-phosphate guanylyltransferase n=1 Tax=Paenibacillus sp. y28 TaxID=3129110 RepID=UPI0030194C88